MFGKVSLGKEKYAKTRFFEIPGVIPRPANEQTPNVNRRILRTPPVNRRVLRNLQDASSGKQVIKRKIGEEVTVSAQAFIKDVSNIADIEEAAYDFIDDGSYADLDATDGLLGDGELWMEITHQNSGSYATIEVGGIAVTANRVHLIVHAANPDEPWLRYNSMRLRGAYNFVLYFRRTGGEDECLDRWTESVG